MAIKVEPGAKQIGELLKGILNGQIGLPAFQRDYVWKPDDEILLIDSILNRYSISSMLFLENAPKVLHTKELEGLEELTTSKPNKPVILILDGQQRLKALVDVFYGAKIKDVKYDYLVRVFGDKGILKLIWLKAQYENKKITGGLIEKFLDDLGIDGFLKFLAWDKTADPGKRGFRKGEYKIKKEENRENYVEISAFAHDDRQNIKNAWSYFEKKKELSEEESVLIDGLVTTIRDRLLFYDIPVISIKGYGPDPVDIGVLTSSFNRVNRTGMRLGAFDIAVACFFKPGKKTLRDLWKETKDNEDYEILKTFDVDPWVVLQLASLRKRDNIKNVDFKNENNTLKESHVFNILNETGFDNEDWEITIESIVETLNFLYRDLGIKFKGLLPPKYIYMVIAGYWPVDKGEKTQSPTALKNFFKKWFWGTILDPGRTPRGPEWPVVEFEDLKTTIEKNKIINKNVPKLRVFKEGLLNRIAPNLESLDEELASLVISNSDRGLNNKKWSDIKTMEAHHIFPTQHLRDLKYPEGEADNALNLIPIDKYVNKVLSDKNPTAWLKLCLERYFKGNEVEFDKYLEAHFLPKYKNKIWDDYGVFIDWRKELVLRKIKEILKIY